MDAPGIKLSNRAHTNSVYQRPQQPVETEGNIEIVNIAGMTIIWGDLNKKHPKWSTSDPIPNHITANDTEDKWYIGIKASPPSQRSILADKAERQPSTW